MNLTRTTVLGLALAVFAPATELLACATCRPDPNDPITVAADMSVLFLGGLVMLILGLITSFFGYLYYRSRNPLLDPAQLIAEADADEPEAYPGHA
jgi:hypothetical protein